MKANTDKCHLIISSNDSSEIKIGNSLIKSSNCKKLLGVKNDTKLTFDDPMKDLCREANNKLCALGMVTPCMGLGRKKLLMNSFFAAQFNYCPIIRMFHSRSNNNKLTYLYERCLRLIYGDKSSSYEKQLERDASVSIHHKTIQATAVEMFKNLYGMSLEITYPLYK